MLNDNSFLEFIKWKWYCWIFLQVEESNISEVNIVSNFENIVLKKNLKLELVNITRDEIQWIEFILYRFNRLYYLKK